VPKPTAEEMLEQPIPKALDRVLARPPIERIAR
jgi:hypothetical protein